MLFGIGIQYIFHFASEKVGGFFHWYPIGTSGMDANVLLL